jgi:hypothetical protein
VIVDDILTEAEIVALTDKVRHAAQARVLDAICIRYKPRPNGSLIVARAHRDAVLGLRNTVRPVEQKATPNFGALDS